MEAETKKCQNCKKDFTLESEDFNFYKKMKVPPPTWCSECRLIRRLSFLNVRTLYKRLCDLCGKSVISMYPNEKKIKFFLKKKKKKKPPNLFIWRFNAPTLQILTLPTQILQVGRKILTLLTM